MRDFEVFELREGLSEILAVDPAARYVFWELTPTEVHYNGTYSI